MDRVGSPLFPCSLPPPFYLAAISSASLLFLPVFFTTQQSIFLFYKISSENAYTIFYVLHPIHVILSALVGAFTLPLYSLGVAQSNDRLKPKQMISASGTIVLVFSVFAALGPFTMSYFLELFEMFGFMIYMGIVHLAIAVTVLIMMFINQDVDESDQSDFQVMAQRPSLVAMEVIAEEAIESQGESDS